jgi:hypothetical protein
MADYPDLYVDGFVIAAGPNNVVITFMLTDPPISGEPGTVPKKPMVRIRMQEASAGELAEALTNVVAQLKAGGTPPPAKH